MRRLQSYGLIFEVVREAPLPAVEYRPGSLKMAEGLSSEARASERGQRVAGDLMLETYSAPGDRSWAERAANAQARKSESMSRENTPSVRGASSKENTPLSSSGRQSSVKESSPVSHTDLINFISGNPFVECTKGIIHLFKTEEGEEVDTSMMLMLGVPAKHKTTDLLQFTAPCHQDLEYMRIVHDGSPNQYMVLLKFRSPSSAMEFHSAYNMLPYNSLEPEVCCVLPVSWVEVMGEDEYSAPHQATELPYCTICLERMDESVSTVLTILCNHKFHSECLSHWEDPTCPVCRYVQTPEVVTDQLCLDCQSAADLWICLVCGYVGCGRYAGGHAHGHFQDTQHCYSMELGHNRVWDYVGDNFVHRLVANTEDGKLVQQEGVGSSKAGADGQGQGQQGVVQGEEKMDSLQLEYTYLLTSQLEDQRSYFMSKLHRVEEEAGKELSAATHMCASLQDSAQKLEAELAETRREKVKGEAKMANLSARLNKLAGEVAEEKQMNACLRSNQEQWQEQLRRKEVELAVTQQTKDREIQELKDQVRDLMFYLESQAKIQESPLKGEIEGGSIVIGDSPGGQEGQSTPRKQKGRRPKK